MSPAQPQSEPESRLAAAARNDDDELALRAGAAFAMRR
jgi:hypothetical protein